MEMSIYDLLMLIKNTSSTKKKEELLKQFKDIDLLEEVLYHTYSPKLKYNVKKIPIENGELIENYSLKRALVDLQMFNRRTITGNAAIEFLARMLNSLDEENSEILKKIISRDLDVGISSKTINKVYGANFIEEMPYMRCNTFTHKRFEKFSIPFIAQEKMDGLFCNVIIQPTGDVEFISRNGKEIRSITENPPKGLVDDLRKILIEEPIVMMGELIVLDELGNIMSREESNGILNSKSSKIEEIQNTVFFVWDMVTLENFQNGFDMDRVTLKEKERTLYALIGNLGLSHIHKVESRECHNLQDAIDYFNEMVAKGGEGVVIKDMDTIWKSGTPSYEMLKLKIEADVDLEVIEVMNGHPRSKWEGKPARFKCASSDRKVEVNVGSGFSDKFRKELAKNPDEYVGKIVTVRCFGLQLAEKSTTHSLYLPRLIEVREKEEADSFEKIQEEIELAKQLKNK